MNTLHDRSKLVILDPLPTNKEVMMASQNEIIPGGSIFNPADAQENPEDESNIISDQDRTESTDPTEPDDNLGAEGLDNPPLSNDPRFIRGELDVKEQMDRAIRAQNRTIGLDPNSDILEDEDVTVDPESLI
jgi:hypothetical protein